MSPFAWYVTAAGSWFLAFGLQGVIVSTLVAMHLHGGSAAMSATMMAQQLPGFGLILVGGAVADRVDKRALLIALYALGSGLAVALALGVEAGWLSLGLVVAYVLSLGTVSAFVMPSRDALLSDVGGGNLMRAVTMLTMTQWGMQALGSAIGIVGGRVGMLPLIGLQAAVLLAGVPALRQLPRPAPALEGTRRALRLGELADGVREVVRSPVLGPVALLSMALGTLFIGPFQVVFPLLVRDYYKGGPAEIAMLYTAFPIGTISGSGLILLRGGIRRKGAAQLFALGGGALCIGAIGLGLPFWGALLAVTLFGFGGAFFVNAGRTLFQEHATSASRGRVLSVYALTIMGATGVVGAPFAGWLNARLGPLGACSVCAALMLTVVTMIAATTNVRKLV